MSRHRNVRNMRYEDDGKPVWKENDVHRIIRCTGISLVHSLVHKQSGNPIVGAQNFITLVGSQNICKNNAFYANLDVNNPKIFRGHPSGPT